MDSETAALTEMEKVNMATLEAAMAAWNGHDLEGILAQMTDDCVMISAYAEDALGVRSEGKEAIRERWTKLGWFSEENESVFTDVHVILRRNVGVATFTMHNGASGLDVYTLRDGKIAEKDFYYKHGSR